MSKLTTLSTSYNSAEIEQDLIIEEKSTTRKIFRAVINDVKKSSGETVSGTIIHQRKKINENWDDYEPIILSQLKAGEGVRLKFHSEPLKRFYTILKELYCLGQEGVHLGEQEFIVGEAERFIEVPQNRKQFIQKLLELEYGEEIWNELVAINPDLVTRLSRARIQHERSEALKEFESSISKVALKEAYWQSFFQKNQWIFGYGLNYQFHASLANQPHYGGIDFTGSGAQKGDFLLFSKATAKFTCLVEIKKPFTGLLEMKNGDYVKYRNGAYLISSELAGGVSQLQVNCKTWQENALNAKNDRILQKSSIYTIQPKGLLIIGNTAEFTTNEGIETFELYRRNIYNPEIITFDELLERAKFIVDKEHSNQRKEKILKTELDF